MVREGAPFRGKLTNALLANLATLALERDQPAQVHVLTV
jgi:hypothetical protein